MDSDDKRDGGPNDWDAFDWTTWGAPPDAQSDAERASRNGHSGDTARAGRGAGADDDYSGDHFADGFLRPAAPDVDVERRGSKEGAWVSQGGIMRWEAPEDEERDEQEDAPLREDAQSVWASEDVQLPLGAPASARVRAVRAWLGRRRQRETDLMGELLLERRKLAERARADHTDDGEAETAELERPGDPLDLALAEAQAAADEYELMLGLFEDTRAHVGGQAALVEFYLAVTERLAALATSPAAPPDFAASLIPVEPDAQASRSPSGGREPSPRERIEWEGRAAALIATRQRVERVSAPEPEDD